MTKDEVIQILNEYHTQRKMLGEPSLIDGEQRLTVNDLKLLSKDELYQYGFGNWEDKLLLYPLWIYNVIKDGEECSCINGHTYYKGKDNIDLDYRFGCIAYGFKY